MYRRTTIQLDLLYGLFSPLERRNKHLLPSRIPLSQLQRATVWYRYMEAQLRSNLDPPGVSFRGGLWAVMTLGDHDYLRWLSGVSYGLGIPPFRDCLCSIKHVLGYLVTPYGHSDKSIESIPSLVVGRLRGDHVLYLVTTGGVPRPRVIPKTLSD